MSQRKGQLHLGAFLYPTGHHIAAWRHPGSHADAGRDFRHYVRLAQAAEAARFDLVFLADGSGTRGDNVDFLSRTAHSYVAQFEPLTLLSALAAVTERIGLVGTASTTFNEPYHIARKFASLDHISGGRAGWNLVTSSNAHEAKNFGFDEHLAHARRYERAVEFAEVVEGLWDSWDEGAFVRDKAAGRYFDPAKRHVLDHRGEFFNVRGPLNVERSPQGRPVVVQAGSSEAGKALAARTAEVIFTAQQTLEDAVAFYADVKGRLAQYGRDPDDLKIMPGVMPIVGATEQEAQDKFAALQALIDPAVGLALVSGLTGGFDLSDYPLDGPIPELPETNASKSRQSLTLELARVDARTGAARETDDPRFVSARRGRTRALATNRYPEAYRRCARGTLRQLWCGRLQRNAGAVAGRPRRLHPTGIAGIAAQRPLPHGIRRCDVAREPGPAAAGVAVSARSYRSLRR